MKKFATFLAFLLAAVGLTLGFSTITGFSLHLSGIFALFFCLLVYLMMDSKPEVSAKDTVYRLTRGNWNRKK